jgi:hypothetical protein
VTPQNSQERSREKKDEPGDYLTVEQLLSLPMFRHLKPATLTRWRCQGIGPGFISIGRKPFYRMDEIALWLRENEVNHERARTARKSAIPVPVARGRDRVFGHKTKTNPFPRPLNN